MMAALALRPIQASPIRARPSLPETSRTIRTPGDMAELLRRCCRSEAAEFARFTYERMCEHGDEERVEFWGEVEELLSTHDGM